MSLITITMDEKLVHNRIKRNTSHVQFLRWLHWVLHTTRRKCWHCGVIGTNDLNIYGYFKFSVPVFILVKMKTFKITLLPNYNAGIPWRRFQNIVFPISLCRNC